MILKNSTNFLVGGSRLSKEINFLKAFKLGMRYNNARFSSKALREYQSYDEEVRALKPITVPELFRGIVEKYGVRAALMSKDVGCTEWSSLTYREYHAIVEKIAKAFIKLGLEQYGSVSVLAFNCPEWFISQLASNHAG